jgi:hypothetical protein
MTIVDADQQAREITQLVLASLCIVSSCKLLDVDIVHSAPGRSAELCGRSRHDRCPGRKVSRADRSQRCRLANLLVLPAASVEGDAPEKAAASPLCRACYSRRLDDSCNGGNLLRSHVECLRIGGGADALCDTLLLARYVELPLAASSSINESSALGRAS